MQHTVTQTTNTPTKRILNQQYILSSIGVSKTTLWRMINAGKFPAPIKIGERLNGWRVETFEGWLDAQGAAQ